MEKKNSINETMRFGAVEKEYTSEAEKIIMDVTAALEEKGYIERRVDENDKRNMLVFPTEKAKEILPKIKLVFREWREYLTEELTEEEKRNMEGILTKLADRAKKSVSSTEADVQ